MKLYTPKRLAVFLLIVIIFAIEIRANTTCNSMFGQGCNISDFLPSTEIAYRWQTLIAGVLAILAAGYGGSFVVKQTLQARHYEEQKRQGKLFASRAMLPFVLSEFIDYCDICCEELSRLLSNTVPGNPQAIQYGPAKFPKIPDSSTEQLITFIESSDLEPRERAATLLRLLQVQASRLKGLTANLTISSRIRPMSVKNSIENYIVDAAVIHAVAASMFEYARGETENVAVSPSIADLTRSLNLLGFDDYRHPSIYASLPRVVARREGLRW